MRAQQLGQVSGLQLGTAPGTSVTGALQTIDFNSIMTLMMYMMMMVMMMKMMSSAVTAIA